MSPLETVYYKSTLVNIVFLLTWFTNHEIISVYTQTCSGNPVDFRSPKNTPYVIGGMFPLHFYSKDKDKYKYNSAGLMWLESMLFAIDEINNRTDILPNITLAYRIFDSCNTIGIALEEALQLTQGLTNDKTSDTCQCEQSLSGIIGLVGDAASSTTTKVASLLAASKIPQISYSATSTDLSQKNLFPSFLRTIPPDSFQAILITDLMVQNKWKYINVVACDDAYGRVGVDELLPKLAHYNVCVAIMEVYDVESDDGTYTTEVIRKLKNEKEATVIVLWCQRPEAMKVLKVAEKEKLYYRTWIATETYGISDELYDINENVVRGMFGIIPTQLTYKPFVDKLKTITPNKSDNNPWLEEYWKGVKKCWKVVASPIPKYVCPETATDLSKLPTNKYINVFEAVYAIAHGLHNYLENNHGSGDVDVKMLCEYVKNVNFVGKSNVTISFNENGDPQAATYTITNLQYNTTKKKLHHVLIGRWSYATRQITNNKNLIQYTNSSIETPKSSCAEPCKRGFYGLRFGDKPCCWKCIECKEGEVQPDKGKLSCTKCTGDKLPNRDRTICKAPKLVHLKPSDTTGIIIIAFMVIGYLLIITCLVILCKYRNTPMVKASNRSLSLLQIISMLFQLATPILFFQPKLTTELCGVTLYYFIFFYTITISVTFTKADRLLRVFKASKSGILAKHSTMKGNSIQYFTVCLLTLVGLTICTIMFAIFAPKVKKTINYDSNEIEMIYSCSGYYDSILFSMVGYLVVISLVCSVYAFKARKLPHDYNEARYTSFAMFNFLLTWMMAVPIYFSRTSAINKSASWCFLCFLSTIVIFVPMYLPKIYVILFKPEENTVQRFRENLKKTTNTMATITTVISDASSAQLSTMMTVKDSPPISTISITRFSTIGIGIDN